MAKKSIDIIVTSHPAYAAEQSDPENRKFIWAYEISITNQSQEIIQLLTRYWLITDMTGRVEEIRGAGVVGLQPLIKPDKQFIYTSYCQLTTPQGTMEGYYVMQNLDEKQFQIEIPKFALCAPTVLVDSYRSLLH